MMKLLLDANLSWRLCKLIQHDFDEVQHVDKIGLKIPPQDITIWQWAKEQAYHIVTNDEDFLHLTTTKGFPPKIVLLRTGNVSTQQVAQLLVKHKDDIQSLANTKEYGVLQIY